jgi:predicted transcriptional regulator
MPKLSSLEAQLTEITREFVARIVETIRNASFGDVAGYPEGRPVARPRGRPPPRAERTERAEREQPATRVRPPGPRATRAAAAGESPPPKRRGRKPRQTVEKRAELGERILAILRAAGGSLGVRAIASEAGTAADLLATPLRELRQGGKIKKHGEKRNTTYSV